MPTGRSTRIALELALLALLLLLLVLVAVVDKASFPSLAEPTVNHILLALLILILGGLVFDGAQAAKASRDAREQSELNLRHVELERDRVRAQLELEREKLRADLELAREELRHKEQESHEETIRQFLLPISRRSPSEMEVRTHHPDAQELYRMARALRDEDPPRLPEAAELFESTYRIDPTFWKAAISAAIIRMNYEKFPEAERILYRVLETAEDGSEQKWAALFNMATLFNRRFLIEKGHEDALRALEINQKAWETLKSGRVERDEAAALTYRNFAAYHFALGNLDNALDWLRRYRQAGMPKNLLGGAFEPEEIATILDLDPSLRDLLG